MKKSIFLLAAVSLAVVLALVIPRSSFAADSDPASVYKALVDAQNAHDADAATAQFTDDGIAIAGSRLYSGKDSIKAWFKAQATTNYHIDPGTPQVTNDRLVVEDKIMTDAYAKLGLTPLADNVQVVVVDGKIKTYVLRLTPQSTVTLGAAQAKAAPGTDTSTITSGVIAALNAGNQSAAAALFADDAVISAPPAGTDAPGLYSGKEMIATYLQNQIAQHFKLESVFNVGLSSDTVISYGRVTTDDWAKLGVTPLDFYAYVVVRNGKVKQFVTNLTGASAAKLNAALANAPK
jgi:hypothetical protein